LRLNPVEIVAVRVEPHPRLVQCRHRACALVMEFYSLQHSDRACASISHGRCAVGSGRGTIEVSVDSARVGAMKGFPS
jgi:hypothetical protein